MLLFSPMFYFGKGGRAILKILLPLICDQIFLVFAGGINGCPFDWLYCPHYCFCLDELDVMITWIVFNRLYKFNSPLQSPLVQVFSFGLSINFCIFSHSPTGNHALLLSSRYQVIRHLFAHMPSRSVLNAYFCINFIVVCVFYGSRYIVRTRHGMCAVCLSLIQFCEFSKSFSLLMQLTNYIIEKISMFVCKLLMSLRMRTVLVNRTLTAHSQPSKPCIQSKVYIICNKAVTGPQ